MELHECVSGYDIGSYDTLIQWLVMLAGAGWIAFGLSVLLISTTSPPSLSLFLYRSIFCSLFFAVFLIHFVEIDEPNRMSFPLSSSKQIRCLRWFSYNLGIENDLIKCQ